jgi:hypothetical protein
MVRKMRAPGFIFVPTRAIYYRRPWVANLDRDFE